MLRLMTFNANGIRSADKKGFWTWFDAQSTDILCVQELKAQEADISEAMKKRPGYHAYFHCAVKKGYSGCGVWSKVEPRHVQIGFGIPEFDDEGRYVRLDFEHTSLIGVYFPSGTIVRRQNTGFSLLSKRTWKSSETPVAKLCSWGTSTLRTRRSTLKIGRGILITRDSCRKNVRG